MMDDEMVTGDERERESLYIKRKKASHTVDPVISLSLSLST